MTNDEEWNRFAKSFLKQTEYITRENEQGFIDPSTGGQAL